MGKRKVIAVLIFFLVLLSASSSLSISTPPKEYGTIVSEKSEGSLLLIASGNISSVEARMVSSTEAIIKVEVWNSNYTLNDQVFLNSCDEGEVEIVIFMYHVEDESFTTLYHYCSENLNVALGIAKLISTNDNSLFFSLIRLGNTSFYSLNYTNNLTVPELKNWISSDSKNATLTIDHSYSMELNLTMMSLYVLPSVGEDGYYSDDGFVYTYNPINISHKSRNFSTVTNSYSHLIYDNTNNTILSIDRNSSLIYIEFGDELYNFDYFYSHDNSRYHFESMTNLIGVERNISSCRMETLGPSIERFDGKLIGSVRWEYYDEDLQTMMRIASPATCSLKGTDSVIDIQNCVMGSHFVFLGDNKYFGSYIYNESVYSELQISGQYCILSGLNVESLSYKYQGNFILQDYTLSQFGSLASLGLLGDVLVHQPQEINLTSDTFASHFFIYQFD